MRTTKFLSTCLISGFIVVGFQNCARNTNVAAYSSGTSASTSTSSSTTTTPDNLSISPTTATISAGGTQQLSASNGQTPYTFKIMSPATGGGSVSSTGLYTAPMSVTQSTAVTISVADALGTSTVAVITVNPVAKTLSCAGTYNVTFAGTSGYSLVLNETAGASTMTGTYVNLPVTGTCSAGTVTFHFDSIPTTIYTGKYSVSGNSVVISGTASFAAASPQPWSAVSSTAPVFY